TWYRLVQTYGWRRPRLRMHPAQPKVGLRTTRANEMWHIDNAHVDDLIATGVLRRVLAFTELKFSNSMIEAWWRSLKHQWLFLHPLDRGTTVHRLVGFYVQEHNRVLPHSGFCGQTPDEMYFGTGDAVPADLTARRAAARRARVEANRSAVCGTCPSAEAA